MGMVQKIDAGKWLERHGALERELGALGNKRFTIEDSYVVKNAFLIPCTFYPQGSEKRHGVIERIEGEVNAVLKSQETLNGKVRAVEDYLDGKLNVERRDRGTTPEFVLSRPLLEERQNTD